MWTKFRNVNKDETKKSVLFILFDEKVVNAAVFSEGAVFSNFKGKKNYLNNINIKNENGLLNFLENADETFEGIQLVLSSIDYKDDSGMINEGRLGLEQILYGAISGGIIISVCCSVCFFHWAALILGTLSGAIAVIILGFVKS